jgi:hypothetical protein
MMLDALDDLGWLAYSREIAMYLKGRYGREVAPTRFSSVPGVKVRKGEFPLEHWRTVALDVLAELEPRDEQLREAAAERLASLLEVQQLFGVDKGPMFPLPSPRRTAGGRSGA